jgi:hypothetical protein
MTVSLFQTLNSCDTHQTEQQEDLMMARFTAFAVSLVVAISLLAASPASAQAPGNHPPANAAAILNALPPDLYKKVERLAQLLDQKIKAGQLTDAQLQQELMSGRLEQTIRGLGPEANRLMDDLQSAMQSGTGLGEDALMPLFGGLGEK